MCLFIGWFCFPLPHPYVILELFYSWGELEFIGVFYIILVFPLINKIIQYEHNNINLNLCILHMFKSIFLLETAQTSEVP